VEPLDIYRVTLGDIHCRRHGIVFSHLSNIGWWILRTWSNSVSSASFWSSWVRHFSEPAFC